MRANEAFETMVWTLDATGKSGQELFELICEAFLERGEMGDDALFAVSIAVVGLQREIERRRSLPTAEPPREGFAA